MMYLIIGQALILTAAVVLIVLSVRASRATNGRDYFLESLTEYMESATSAMLTMITTQKLTTKSIDIIASEMKAMGLTLFTMGDDPESATSTAIKSALDSILVNEQRIATNQSTTYDRLLAMDDSLRYITLAIEQTSNKWLTGKN